MVKSTSSFSNCIVIGKGLAATCSYHLLIDSNGVKIDRIMSEEERILITNVIEALKPILNPGVKA